jgi:L-alanine-DL-glutamate epimerase-like enolase superfamily enzyme
VPRATDIHPIACALYFLPVEMRLPLKFGNETLSSVTVARVRLRAADRRGRSAEGWGETPLSVQWVWPSALPYEERHQALKDFSVRLVKDWAGFRERGHAFEVGHAFLEERLPRLWKDFNAARAGREPMPWLAALVASSAFDLALHDAFGVLHGAPVYATYTKDWMSADLGRYLEPAAGTTVDFAGKHPADYLVAERPAQIPAWHLVGGVDLLEEAERSGREPDDGYPVTLREWIRRDGADCLKVKLRGNDAGWDYERLARVGRIADEEGPHWLSADFNCTVEDPGYVNDILDRLLREHPSAYAKILYVEQPFPYDLEAHPIDVRSVSARKPLFMDESAHDWKVVRRGRELGWSGVALKTCKTQTGALLSLAWAKAHGMTLMVQDLTNPMLAIVPHVLLAAHAGTILGVETNACQFYPRASEPEERVHPGLYTRRGGALRLDSIAGPGFGYQIDRIARRLPEPAAANE